eukprot:g39742.t1
MVWAARSHRFAQLFFFHPPLRSCEVAMDLAQQLEWLDKKLIPDWPIFQGPPDERLFGSFGSCCIMTVAYVVLMAYISLNMKDKRKELAEKSKELDKDAFRKYEKQSNKWLKPFTVVHNVTMTVYSLYAFVGVSAVLYRNWKAVNFDLMIPFCDPKGQMDIDMDYWFYTFYLSKFLEWFDTIFLLLKGKEMMPPGDKQYFLHVFHHTTTSSIVWVAWRTGLSVSWTGPWTNAIVHTFMYAYYLGTDLGLPKFFGFLVTPIQIIQFIFCLASVSYEVTHMEECNSTPSTIYWMIFTYGVFLLFFVDMFVGKCRGGGKGKPKKKEQ